MRDLLVQLSELKRIGDAKQKNAYNLGFPFDAWSGEIMVNQSLLSSAGKSSGALKAQKTKTAQRLRAQKERLRARKGRISHAPGPAMEKERLRRKKAKEAARAKAAREKGKGPQCPECGTVKPRRRRSVRARP